LDKRLPLWPANDPYKGDLTLCSPWVSFSLPLSFPVFSSCQAIAVVHILSHGVSLSLFLFFFLSYLSDFSSPQFSSLVV
jgi:small neutral amino acid transporter SnatA (MarC family)